MITIQKQNVANWLMVEYLATLHAVNEKIRLFEHKYAQRWEEFSTDLKATSAENFDHWDDYIEWKAYVKMAGDLARKIDEVKHGNFMVT
jgi:hypothetical protein